VSHPDESGRAIVHPLDTPFGEFQLNSNGRIYAIEVRRLHSQPLYYGLLEWSFMDPEDWADELAEAHRDELERTEHLGIQLSLMWLHWESPVLLTPPPDWRSAEFQNPPRWQGNLCAATLTSLDEFFPAAYRNDDGTEVPADYSEASVIYATLRGEGPLPERIRRGIDWEKVAKPKLF
jgi:hypothetical protein